MLNLYSFQTCLVTDHITTIKDLYNERCFNIIFSKSIAFLFLAPTRCQDVMCACVWDIMLKSTLFLRVLKALREGLKKGSKRVKRT